MAHRAHHLRSALGVAVAVLMAAPGGAAADGPPALVVDRDHVQCPAAGYTSINAAVQAAAPGATIVVCPDTYNEDVLVDRPLTIRAQHPASSGASGGSMRCAVLASQAPDPTHDAIVSGGLIGFNLRADDITIDGFVVQDELFGLSASTAVSGDHITNNLIQDNDPVGVRMRSNGVKRSELTGNCLRRQGALGALVSTGGTNMAITGNGFYRNAAAGILVSAASGIDVSANLSVEDAVFTIVFPGSQDLTITANTALRSQDPDVAAIALGGTTHSTVSRNLIADGRGNGLGFAGPAVGGALSTGITVDHNLVHGMGASGIRVTPDSLADSAIQSNVSDDNTLDGVRIEAGAANTGNQITRNLLHRNREHDCHDDTLGTGTAGTANLWAENVAATENRPGLCRARGRS
jgi:hypothetical protein